MSASQARQEPAAALRPLSPLRWASAIPEGAVRLLPGGNAVYRHPTLDSQINHRQTWGPTWLAAPLAFWVTR